MLVKKKKKKKKKKSHTYCFQSNDNKFTPDVLRHLESEESEKEREKGKKN
jgi:hypothetical protein